MKSGNLNFLEPSGHLGPVVGLIYLLHSAYADSLSVRHPNLEDPSLTYKRTVKL